MVAPLRSRLLSSARAPDRDQLLLPLRRHPCLELRLSRRWQRPEPIERLARSYRQRPKGQSARDLRRDVEARESFAAIPGRLPHREVAVGANLLLEQEIGAWPHEL